MYWNLLGHWIWGPIGADKEAGSNEGLGDRDDEEDVEGRDDQDAAGGWSLGES